LLGADGYLRLETLRYSDEIVQLGRLAPPSHRQPDKREIALAEQLIGTLEDTFKPGDFRDEHREQVMQLIRDKQRGRSTRMPKAAAAKKSEGSLREHLEASLKAAHG
jgi:non-homologous end joining protein Ku